MPLFVVLNCSPSSPTQGLKQTSPKQEPPAWRFLMPHELPVSAWLLAIRSVTATMTKGREEAKSVPPNSLTKITLKSWSACSTHVPLTEARPHFHFGTMFYIPCQHITGSPWKGENQQVNSPAFLFHLPPPHPRLGLSLLPPPFLSVCASSHTWERIPGGTPRLSLSSSLIPLVSVSPKRWWIQRKVLWPWKQDSLRDDSGSTAWELCDSDSENQLVFPRGKEGIAQEFGMDMYTRLYIYIYIGSQQGPTVRYVPAWMGGEPGGEWIRVYVRLSCSALHLKLSRHC